MEEKAALHDPGSVFAEICASIMQQACQAFDAENDVVCHAVEHTTEFLPMWVNHANEASCHGNVSDAQNPSSNGITLIDQKKATARAGQEGNSDLLPVRGQNDTDTGSFQRIVKRCSKEDNSDRFVHHNQRTGKSGVDAIAPGETLEPLNDAIHTIFQPEWEGLNSCFASIPQVHPFAKIALDSTETVGMDCSGTLQIFTDGACRAGKAAWALVVVRQTRQQGRVVYQKTGFAAGLPNDGLETCEVNALNAEATALMAVAEFLLSCPEIDKSDIHCHFHAQAVGYGAFGVSNCCTWAGDTVQRQPAARILMSMVQRKARNIEGTHTHAHVGHPWNELADSIAGALCDGWQPLIAAELRSQRMLSHPLKEWAWMQINPNNELPILEEVLMNQQPTSSKGQIDSTLLHCQDPEKLTDGTKL